MAEILLIDDMKGVRRSIVAMLTRAGHVVTEAEDGAAGLEILRGNRVFDLVISDIIMPRHDGNEVMLHLERQANRPKCILISGGDSDVSSDQALLVARGMADGILEKPFDSATLTALVDRLLATT